MTRIVLVALIFTSSLSSAQTPFSPAKRALVADSVNRMMQGIARDITANGPSAWLIYFEDSPDFFMASDGKLAFQDHESARLFIENTLVKNISHINLIWSDIRIDPLTPGLASAGATFHEEISDSAGKITPYDGYFTGVAERTDRGWQLRSAHWSSLKTK
jgi:hypothetical protein